MRKCILVLLMLTASVCAGRAGLVVQFNSSSVTTKCVEFQGNATAYDFLRDSGLSIVTKDYGAGLGIALCGIEEVGCGADNCFCQSSYWGFYVENGGWVYSPVGIGSYQMKDGDVLGFRWGVWGDEPELQSFNELCPSAPQNGERKEMRYLNITANGNCTNEPASVEVKERGGDAPWEPTGFMSASQEGVQMRVENGVGVKVLLYQTSFGRNAGFEKVAMLFTDREGKANFTPEEAGSYLLAFEKDGFFSEERELDIVDCRKEVAENRTVEEVGIGKEEPNITRVDITAPATAVVNSTVLVKVTFEDGNPLVYGSVTVGYPGGQKQLITNESGEATFRADEEGVYSYISPNHTLVAYRLTSIISGAEFHELKGPETKAQQQGQSEAAAPSVAMSVSNPFTDALPVLAGGILILAFLYLLKGVRK